jgi:hypothetical protein
MRILMASTWIAASMLIAATSAAQAPAGSTGACKDGTYTSAATKRGACAGHGGVKDWYSNTAATKAPAASKVTTPEKAPATTMAPAAPAPAAPAAKGTTAAATAPAAGGGPGQVWVNSASKVYHCAGDKWYGKTKKGEYMTEAAAKAAGNRPDHGKGCS